MSLVSPDLGTIFWLLVVFGVVVLILSRFAWKPILNALKEREVSIKEALQAAEIARQRVDELKADQDAIKVLAIREKEIILMEAREIKDKIIAEAKEKATYESSKIMEQLRNQMEIEKMMALDAVKQQIADFSVQIAEKILHKNLESTPQQEKLIHTQLEEFKLN